MCEIKVIQIQRDIGYIYGVVEGRIGFINFVFVKPEHRGNKFGIMLIKLFFHAAMKEGAIRVELDDCSDNYRKKNNLYLKFGFRYKNSDGEEMFANIRNLLKLG